MANRLKLLLSKILGTSHSTPDHDKGFSSKVDRFGINFYLEQEKFIQLENGEGNQRELVQRVVLGMLEEQGLAERLPNGFHVSSNVVSNLDDDEANILSLPARFPGHFDIDISGHTKKSSFKVQLSVILDNNNIPVSIQGPLLIAGSSLMYRMTGAELAAFKEVEYHNQLPTEQKTEENNLRLIAALQESVHKGMELELKHFETLDVVIPKSVSLTADNLPDGSLELSPCFGDGSTPQQLENRWHQLDTSANSGALRVENRIVLLQEETMQAVKEVLGNRRIPKDQISDFIRTPTAFLDASLVNLDMGFSVRVLGVGKLKHIDFGSEDDQKRDWFASGSSPAPAQVLNNLVESHEDLIDVESRLQAAKAQGADVLEYQGQEIDISDDDQVSEILLGISEKLRQLEESATSPTPPIVKNEEKERVSLILKEAEIINQSLFDGLDNQASITEPDWSDYSRTPYPHQKEGILWVLNLLERALISNKEDLYRVQGGLLADDMGLGKTYMTLVALGEYLKKQRDSGLPEKPILIVAPLSLLENWEQEINQTFKMVPFKDIKVLQSGRDLQEFRIKDTERETVQLASAFNDDEVLDQSSIRYALKVGPESGANRLDINRRLVLTTYQTLRDYQFSLCVIDWGLVVFDEAQNVKNPNTLQSRAAKGLKADFKLLATGTPVENSLADFWCLTDTAQPGLLGEWQQFRDDWIKPINEASEENKNEVRQHVGGALRAAVGMFMLRRIKEDQLQGLPTKFIYSGVSSTEENAQRSDDLVTYMKGEQLSAYDAVLDDYRHRKMVEDMQGQALSTLQKLRLVSLHPELSGSCNHLMTSDPALAKKYMMKSGKLQILLSVLDRIQKNDEKVILFMVTKQLQRLLKIWLDAVYSLNIHVINGDTAAVHKKKDTMTRKKMIEDFESVSGFNIIIMSPVAAGVGLTVVGANHVIHLERHWNPAKEAQATDRVYRIGQKKDVHIHLPAVLHPEFDSFDVHLHRLLNGKLMLKDAVVTPDIVSENEMLSALDC